MYIYIWLIENFDENSLPIENYSIYFSNFIFSGGDLPPNKVLLYSPIYKQTK
jgi:hypothetical protein